MSNQVDAQRIGMVMQSLSITSKIRVCLAVPVGFVSKRLARRIMPEIIKQEAGIAEEGSGDA